MHRREAGLTTDTEAATARGQLGPPEAGRGRKHPPLDLQRGRGPAPTWMVDSWAPGPGENKCLLFEATQLSSFVTAIARNFKAKALSRSSPAWLFQTENRNTQIVKVTKE